jgi:aryl-alcohol dehydrogenase-like predicted oxidoreductase
MTSPERAMPLRPLGSTGLSVTPIGLGLAALGRPAYINLGRDQDLGAERAPQLLERRSHRVLDEAYRLGVRYFDVARSYGKAEAFLASWLSARGLPPGSVTVGSKWGYVYTGDWRLDADVHEVKDHSVATFRRQLGESRGLLGEHLDLYQIHSATLESGVLEDRAVLAELVALGEEGVVCGVSVSGPRQAEAIRRGLEGEVDGVNPFRSVQATWNVLEPSAGPALEEAHGAGWGVIVKEAVANGRLTAHGSFPDRARLDRPARRHGCGPDAVAIAAVLAQPWVDVLLAGAVSVEQLRSNVAGVGVRLSPSEVEGLLSAAEPPEVYWRTRSSLDWG